MSDCVFSSANAESILEGIETIIENTEQSLSTYEEILALREDVSSLMEQARYSAYIMTKLFIASIVANLQGGRYQCDTYNIEDSQNHMYEALTIRIKVSIKEGGIS